MNISIDNSEKNRLYRKRYGTSKSMERAREWNSQAGRFLTESRLNLPYTAAYANISRVSRVTGQELGAMRQKRWYRGTLFPSF